MPCFLSFICFVFLNAYKRTGKIESHFNCAWSVHIQTWSPKTQHKSIPHKPAVSTQRHQLSFLPSPTPIETTHFILSINSVHLWLRQHFFSIFTNTIEFNSHTAMEKVKFFLKKNHKNETVIHSICRSTTSCKFVFPQSVRDPKHHPDSVRNKMLNYDFKIKTHVNYVLKGNEVPFYSNPATGDFWF